MNPRLTLPRSLPGRFAFPMLHHVGRRSAALLGAALVVLSAGSLSAAVTLTWDASGENPADPVGGAGTWSTGSANWSNGEDDVAWDNAGGNTALFLGNLPTSATVTVALGSNITVNSITFGSGGSGFYSISGGSYGLTLTSGLVTVNRTATIQASITGSNGFDKAGSSTLTLFAANSYTGNTVIRGGSLQARATGALPSSTVVTIGSGSATAVLDIRASQTVAGIARGTTGTATITNSQTEGTTTLTINPDGAGGAAADSTFGGVIQDGSATRLLALTKAGSRTLTLTGTNTYTGATTVNGGSLLLAGGGSLASAVTVNAGTFGGSGSTSNQVTIGNNAGGHDAFIAPGGGGAGTFTTSGSLTLNSDAVFAFELNGGLGIADRLSANGVTIDSDALFSFTLLGGLGGLAVNDQFVLIDHTGAGAINGTFGNLVAGGSFDAGGGLIFAVSGSGGVYGNDLVLTVTAVPEPAPGLLLAALAFTGALCQIVRRRKSCGAGA